MIPVFVSLQYNILFNLLIWISFFGYIYKGVRSNKLFNLHQRKPSELYTNHLTPNVRESKIHSGLSV